MAGDDWGGASTPPEPITRWVGPIPECSDAPEYASDARQVAGERLDGFDAPCGPAPVWGGYRPQRALPHPWGPYQTGEIPGVWSSLQDERDALVRGWGYDIQGEEEWWADSVPTALLRRGGEWWVGCPARLCCRAVVIAAAAIRDGAEPPPGILPEEAAKAREILASDNPRARAWAASGGWDLAAWPRPAPVETEAEQIDT